MDFGDFNNSVNSVLGPLQQKPFSGLLRMILVLYGGMAAPQLPASVLRWFEFPAFRIFFLAMIVYMSTVDPAVSILIAVCFYTSMNALSGKKLFEKFEESNDGQVYYYE